MKAVIYVLSWNNPARKARLEDRFKQVGLTPNFIETTSVNDPELVAASKDHPDKRRNWAIMNDHLKMIKAFLAGDATHGIFCEDDIYLKRTMATDLPVIMAEFDRLKLDLLLLGYLLDFNPAQTSNEHKLKRGSFTYHEYTSETWGAEMYMLSRKHARWLIEKYNYQWASSNPDKPFTSDWILTKDAPQPRYDLSHAGR